MHFSLVSLALLTTSALAITPVLNEPPFFHSMLARGADLSARQDSAYQPTTTNCTGGGDTCETMCGKETTECPTDDKEKLFCRQKATSRCCSDRSGNSCNRGYYCSSNDLGEHYCCLDGQDADACAQAYSAVSEVVVTQTQTTTVIIKKTSSRLTAATTTTTAATDDVVDTSVDTPSSTTLPALTSSSDESDLSSATFTGQPLPTIIGQPLSTTTGPTPSPSSGGAGKVAGAGLAALAGVVGVARLL